MTWRAATALAVLPWLAGCVSQPYPASLPVPAYGSLPPPVPLAPPPLQGGTDPFPPPVTAEPLEPVPLAPPPLEPATPEPAKPEPADSGVTLPDGTVLIPPAADAPAAAAAPAAAPDPVPKPAPPAADSKVSIPMMGFRPMKGQTKATP